jgi:hypothetical protein
VVAIFLTLLYKFHSSNLLFANNVDRIRKLAIMGNMNIKVTGYRNDGRVQTLERFFGRSLDSHDCDENGVVERAMRTAGNNSDAIGRLVSVLTDKGILNLKDIIFI